MALYAYNDIIRFSKLYRVCMSHLFGAFAHTRSVRLFVCSRRSLATLRSNDSRSTRMFARGSLSRLCCEPWSKISALNSVLVLRREERCARRRRITADHVAESLPISWTRNCSFCRSLVREAPASSASYSTRIRAVAVVGENERQDLNRPTTEARCSSAHISKMSHRRSTPVQARARNF